MTPPVHIAPSRGIAGEALTSDQAGQPASRFVERSTSGSVPPAAVAVVRGGRAGRGGRPQGRGGVGADGDRFGGGSGLPSCLPLCDSIRTDSSSLAVTVPLSPG